MPIQAQRGGGGVTPAYSQPHSYKRVSGQQHAPAAVSPEKVPGAHRKSLCVSLERHNEFHVPHTFTEACTI